MNIGLFTTLFRTTRVVNTGIGNHLYDLSQALSKEGHNVHVLYFILDREDNDSNYTDGNVHVHPVCFKIPACLRRKENADGRISRVINLLKYIVLHFYEIYKAGTILNSFVNDHSIDIIETSNLDYGDCLWYLMKREPIPVVTRVSTTWKQSFKENRAIITWENRFLSWFERHALKRCKYLVTHTSAHRDDISTQLNIIPDTIKLIPHGINFSRAPLSNKVKRNDNQTHILYLGRFQYRKGIDILLEAIPKVLDELNSVHFILAGNDDNKRFQTMFWNDTTNLKRKHNVTFVEEVTMEERSRLYGNCDIFVAPSRYESFGLVYVEAMSYGKPVIGTNVGGIPEVIEDKVTGLLVNNNDPSDLTNKLIELAQDRRRQLRMGEAGIKRVQKYFTSEIMVKDTLDHYSACLKTQRLC
jgi:glycosyltransferase involved in cell wall biosynthesis